MGVMYEAVQESLGRRITLNVSPADRGRRPFLERFSGEAPSAARLCHTNIVPVFGVGRAGDTEFYVMHYIDDLGLDCLLEDVWRRPPCDAITQARVPDTARFGVIDRSVERSPCARRSARG
jgi:serine/threonine-protein kinase